MTVMNFQGSCCPMMGMATSSHFALDGSLNIEFHREWNHYSTVPYLPLLYLLHAGASSGSFLQPQNGGR